MPDGWEGLVEGTSSISHFNYGAMDFDPATMRNGDIFVDGRIAMMGQWDYHFSRAENEEQSSVAGDVGFTTTPSWDSQTDGKALGDFQIMAMNGSSDNIPAAKLFLDYVRSEQAHSNEFLLEGNNTLVKTVYDRASAVSEVDAEYLQAHKALHQRRFLWGSQTLSMMCSCGGT